MTNRFSKTNPTGWIIEIEEDPETHELVLPLPADALAQVGWDYGDTIEWNIDPLTHQVTIQKKQ
jgi:hypothetical protein